MQATVRDMSGVYADSRGVMPIYQTQRVPVYPPQVYFSQPPQYNPPQQFNPSNTLRPSMVYQSQSPILYQSQQAYPLVMQQLPPQYLVNTLPIVRKQT